MVGEIWPGCTPKARLAEYMPLHVIKGDLEDGARRIGKPSSVFFSKMIQGIEGEGR